MCQLLGLAVIATAPGKLILTGEYAVLDGAPALVIAVDRRVVARRDAARGSSPFLLAVARELAQRYGADSPGARAALEIAVDSSAFYDGEQKLGLGSSAAVTVAATALAVAAQHGSIDRRRDEILELALAAHANAQGARGARGSGADIAAAVHGGAIAFTMPGTIERRRWPSSVTLIPFFTGASADTAALVSQIVAARNTHRDAVDAALSAIADASRAACAALAAPADFVATGLLDAFTLAAVATDRLATATGVPLVPPCVTAARSAMQALGGTAKTTGAGGGDVAIAVIPASADVTIATRLLIERGCQPLQLTVDDSGVDTRLRAQ
jgi:phosphomevalonate kinase